MLGLKLTGNILGGGINTLKALNTVSVLQRGLNSDDAVVKAACKEGLEAVRTALKAMRMGGFLFQSLC